MSLPISPFSNFVILLQYKNRTENNRYKVRSSQYVFETGFNAFVSVIPYNCGICLKNLTANPTANEKTFQCMPLQGIHNK
jgi:hypothetical protein